MQPRDLVRQTAFAVAILVSVVSVAHATPQYGRAPEVTGPPQWIMQSPAADSTLLLLPNAGFETGTFAGWTVADEAGGSGSWFVYNSGFSPLNGFQIPPPPRGHYAAVTDQRGPGSHLLFRDIAVPNTPSTLTFAIFYENQAGSFSTPPTLDAMGMVGNQQFRVDLIKPSAFIASVAPADVLLNIFQTQVGDPPVLAPTLFTVDLTPFAGQTVRLRFAEVDNMSNFQAGVDDGIVIIAAPTLSPTALATTLLLVLALGAWGLARRSQAN